MEPEAIILMSANDSEHAEILKTMQGGRQKNRVFKSADAAFEWVENNAKVGWVTKIIEID